MVLKHKNSLIKNITSGFVGQGWTFLVGMIAVPFYIRFLGIEGYGLVGFYGALRATLNSFLDFGLGITLQREIARYSVSQEKIGNTRDLARTMEVIYWLIGLLLGLTIYFSVPFISNYWLNSEAIPISTIERVVAIMGIITFIQWPLTLYQGGLIGLQEIVLLNGINIVASTLRGIGGILAVWLFPSPIMAFFWWQVLLSLFHLSATTYFFWQKLPKSDHPLRFQKKIIVEVWRFALGMSGSSFFSFFLGQADRIILSKILNLENFGYYSLATTLNDQIKMISAQIHKPLFPRFSALISLDDQETLRKLYHKSCQLVAVIIFPIAGTAAFFSQELIYLWIQDMKIASVVAPIATLLFIGTAFSALIGIPFSLTIAYGWVKFVFYRSLILSILIVPLMVVLSSKYAGVGAALTWVILNLLQLLILPLIIHHRILKNEIKRWYVFDVGIPLLSAVAMLSFARWLLPLNLNFFQHIIAIGIITLTVFMGVILATGEVRGWSIKMIRNYLPKIN